LSQSEPAAKKNKTLTSHGTSEQKSAETKEPRRWAPLSQWLVALAVGAGIIIVDQLSKMIVVKSIPLYSWITLIDPFLRLTRAENNVGIFSLSFGPSFLYVILPLVAVGFVVYLLLRPQTRFVTVLLGMIIGGGFGNFIDRIRLGYVVDWISMGFRNWRWATFNLADSSVVVAVIVLLILELFFSKSKTSSKETSAIDEPEQKK
jgi:signal peptidase II